MMSKYLEREIIVEDLDKNYEELGADSVDLVSLAFEVEKEFNIEILPEIFLEHRTIRKALDHILESN